MRIYSKAVDIFKVRDVDFFCGLDSWEWVGVWFWDYANE